MLFWLINYEPLAASLLVKLLWMNLLLVGKELVVVAEGLAMLMTLIKIPVAQVEALRLR